MDAYAPADLRRPLEGTTVTICVCGHLNVDAGFASELAAFKERTGIRVVLTPVDPETTLSSDLEEPDRRPDVVMFPNEIPEWAYDRAMDINRFVDPETLRSDFGDYLLNFATSDRLGSAPAGDGAVRAIPSTIDPKGLVFYPKAEFQKAGYQIPKTWDELLVLSDRIVADGRTPWCFALRGW